jgi:hypothetical protein
LLCGAFLTRLSSRHLQLCEIAEHLYLAVQPKHGMGDG